MAERYEQINGLQRIPRLVWGDILRVVSIFCVVCLHCAAHKWKGSFDGTMNPEWVACAIQTSFWRGNVPVMLMLSGALILSRESACALKKLPYRMLSIMLPLIVWSLVFIYLRDRKLVFMDVFSSLTKKQMYHLWFVYMMAGLYCTVPILKLIRDRMVIDIPFACLIFGLWFISCFIHAYFPSFRKVLQLYYCDKIFLYGGYFLLGSYIVDKISHSHRIFFLSIVCFIASFVFTSGYTLWVSYGASQPIGRAFSDFTPNILLLATSKFILFIQVSDSFKEHPFIAYLADKMFIVYLIHPLFLDKIFVRLDFLRGYWFHLRILLCGVLTFTLSLLTAMVLRLIFKKRMFVG